MPLWRMVSVKTRRADQYAFWDPAIYCNERSQKYVSTNKFFKYKFVPAKALMADLNVMLAQEKADSYVRAKQICDLKAFVTALSR